MRTSRLFFSLNIANHLFQNVARAPWSTITMVRHLVRITTIALFLFALMFAGRFGAHSDSTARRDDRPVFDASYRRHLSPHKIVVQANEPDLRDSIMAR